jgi:hypothetical protein
VAGGVQGRNLPSPIQPGELAVHAIGRLDTMGEILVQAAWLRCRGFAHQATGYARAAFQDMKGDYSGTSKIAAAHRAMFALQLDGCNATNLPRVAGRPQLHALLVAPQARTDMVMRPVNYADQLLENAASQPVFELFRNTLQWQRQGQPVDRAPLMDAVLRLRQLLHDGFDAAMTAFEQGQQGRGVQEWRPGSGPAPLAGASQQQVDSFVDNAFGGGMRVHVAGPTHYGDLPAIILGLSQEITDQATPALTRPATLDAQLAALEAAAR